MRKLLAEFLGTFTLVFVGTGAIVIDQVSGGAIGQGGIALTFGLVVLVVIATFGIVSGAHVNPAVSLAMAAARRHPWRQVPGYLSAQLLGALTASLLLRGLFPASATLGATLPTGPVLQSFLLEVGLAMLLMLTVLSVTHGAQERGAPPAVFIGAMVGLLALFAGPISGASMNPARSLAPALVSGHIQHLWVYVCAPVLGAMLAVPLCMRVHPPGCCRGHCGTGTDLPAASFSR